MFDAIPPILNLGKSITIANHKGEYADTKFEGRMKESQHRISIHGAYRHIVCCSATAHMENHHKQNRYTFYDLGVVAGKLKTGCIHYL